MTHFLKFAGTAVAATLFAGASSLAAESLPLNQPTRIDGVRAVCTGIGADQQSNPRWNAWPAKVVVVGRHGQYLAGETVTIADNGQTVIDARCGGPMLYARLSPGRYQVTVHREGRTTAATLEVPRQGQSRAVLSFPREGGAVSD